MTAGQGGHDGEPDGGGRSGPPPPPQDWNAPPAPPQGWGPPPGGYGGPPPQGWGASPNPYAAPVPAGYGQPPAGSPEQPLTVRAGIGAFVVNFVLGLVVSLVSFADLDELVREAARSTSDPDITEEVLRTAIFVGAVIGLVLVVLHALFIWWAWKGRNWARIVLWVLGGLNVVAGLSTLGGDTAGGTDFLAALSGFQLLALVAGIVLLALKPSNDWYRYMSWARTTGQLR
ncbi:hypothetical protein [Blastococcus sp. CCUG 61487]|uniref:hypothetical protein n=1 Tax=Blastococcus sp. CCUG 61487 TaxID=1840703 RepID=UPI0010BF9A8F|nr:hypothetical protein [Blastococcus sp. CCUG 61487]